MKFTKRILSIVMAMVMLCSLLAVSAVTASAEETMTYDDNVLASYDQYVMHYGYGTGVSANWPRQVTFNNEGWMRIQSRTPEEVANDDMGTASKQWQYYGHATPEYDAQLKNAIQKSDGIAAIYTYVREGAGGTGTGSPEVETELHLGIEFDQNGDGFGNEASDQNVLSATTRTQVNSKYGFRWSVALLDLSALLESEYDYKLTNTTVNIQGYSGDGLSKLDVFVSPVYTQNLPGFDTSINAESNFDAESLLDLGSFSINNGDFDVEDWTWEYPNADDPITEQEDKDSRYKRGDIIRDEDNYPLNKNGIAVVKSPITMKVVYADAVVSGLKVVSQTSSSATLSWNGENAVSYFVNEKDGKIDNVKATTTTATIYGLRAGQTYNFRVRGYNKANKAGAYSAYVTVTIASPVVKPSAPVVSSVAVTNKNQVTVKWGKVNGATSYDVQRKIGSKAWTTVKAGTTGVSYVDTKATTAGTYSYRVVAKNSAGTAISAAKTVKVMNFKDKATIKSVKPGKKQVTVTISKKVTNANGYQYQVGTNKKVTKGKKTLTTTKAKATIKKLSAKKVYYVKVRAYKTINGKKVYGAWSAVKKASGKTK